LTRELIEEILNGIGLESLGETPPESDPEKKE
jgi:hypothetical protein